MCYTTCSMGKNARHDTCGRYVGILCCGIAAALKIKRGKRQYRTGGRGRKRRDGAVSGAARVLVFVAVFASFDDRSAAPRLPKPAAADPKSTLFL